MRTELLLQMAVLAAGALVVGVAGVLLLAHATEPAEAAPWLTLLVALDVGVFVAFAAFLVRRLVLLPLGDALAAAEAIAGGDLERRVPAGATREFEGLARSLNRMTDRLLEERRHLVRVEKLASIGRLGAGVAHEIGNPLGAIQGYLHLARTAGADDARRAEALDGLERETSRIDRIVRGLLDYARGRRATPTPVDVNAAVHGVIDLLAAQGTLRRVAVTTDLAIEEARIVADRHDMEQLFVNLLLNAADAMGGQGRIAITTRRLARAELEKQGRRRGESAGAAPQREPSPRVRLWLDSAHRPNAALKVVVADSGPGIPSADVERVFDPFFTTKEPGKGTGLGLAIVLRIVDNAGGTIWVEHAREGGAAFHMLFPLAASRS